MVSFLQITAKIVHKLISSQSELKVLILWPLFSNSMEKKAY